MTIGSFATTLCFTLAFGCVQSARAAADLPREVLGEQQHVESSSLFPIWSASRDIPTMQAIYRRGGQSEGGLAGNCPSQTVAHTDASFTGGSYIVQAGFAEQEIAAVSFTVPAAAFPMRLDMTEIIFATSSATVQTTTKWSILVWEGNPSGTPKYVFSSDAKILPHIVLPPGTSGVNVQFLIDPQDPEQMYLDDNGTQTFSIGYRIDDHNNQTQNPCFVAPPSASNAFPTTDVSGLAQPTRNWLYLLNCGSFGCGVGWKTFAQLPSVCRPSGDWVMRATYTPLQCSPGQGACCVGTNCSLSTQANCQSVGGSYRGDGSVCTSTICQPQGNNACCFAATGGCVALSYQSCVGAGGVPGPEGSACGTYTCFPTGACCLPDGSCVGPVSPSQCSAQGGNYRGNNSVCSQQNCPPPQGAACFTNGFCLILSQADAAAAGASWKGAGTTCADGNGNGTAEVCERRIGDVNGDNLVNGMDLSSLLAAWASNFPAADFNNDGTVNGTDLTALLANWDDVGG